MLAMNIKNQSPHKRMLLITLAGVLLLVVGSVVYFAFFTDRDPTADYTPQYPQSVSNDDGSAENNPDGSTKKTPIVQTDQTSEDIPVSPSGAVEIANLNQKDGYVNALAKITNFSTTKCVYLFESEGARPIAREQLGGCSGISIPEVEFEKIGTYTLTVTAYNNSSKITAKRDIVVR